MDHGLGILNSFMINFQGLSDCWLILVKEHYIEAKPPALKIITTLSSLPKGGQL